MKKFIFISLVLTSAAFAQNKSQQALIDKDTRPSTEQILSNPANLNKYNANASFKVDAYDENFHKLIVSLEKAFPGGTYAFLGRDMDLIADTVEAYYLSIGQKGRVKHIPFSTPSMQGATDASVAGLLRGLGLNTQKGKYTGPEFVMVDYTSFSGGSQSTLIANSVVRYLKGQGLTGAEIVRRFNVLTIEDGLDNAFDPINSKGTSLAFKKSQAQEIQKEGSLSKIFTADVGDSSMAYTSAWHDRFGPITRAGNRYVTKPLQYISAQNKAVVLSEMIEAIKYVTTAKMKAKVNALAKKYKVVFSAPDPKNIPDIPEANPNKDYVDNLLPLRELEKRADDEKTVKVKLEGEKIRLSPNGSQVLAVINDPYNIEASQYLEITLQALVALYEEGKIGVRDFRRILIIALNNKDSVSSTFLKMVETYYKKSYPLEIFLGRDYERTQYSSLQSNAGLNYKKMISLPNTKKPSCRFTYADINPR